MTIITKPIKVTPEEASAYIVVPSYFTADKLLSVWHSARYYERSIGLVRWVNTSHMHEFVSFFGPGTSIPDMPDANEGYPLSLPAGAMPCKYRPIAWCPRTVLVDYLNSKLLPSERFPERLSHDNDY